MKELAPYYRRPLNKVVADHAQLLFDIADGKKSPNESDFTWQVKDFVYVIYSTEQLNGEDFIGFLAIPVKEDGEEYDHLVEEIIERLQSTSDRDAKPLDFDQKTKNLRLAMARVAMNFVVYLNAGGMLEASKLHNRPKLGTVAPKVEKIPSTIVGWHWRRAHFRTLRAERFYKGQTYPPERYRIIPVKNTVVMKENDPATPDANIIWPLKTE